MIVDHVFYIRNMAFKKGEDNCISWHDSTINRKMLAGEIIRFANANVLFSEDYSFGAKL